MRESLILSETEPVKLFNNAIVCKLWEPKGYTHCAKQDAFFCLMRKNCKSTDITDTSEQSHSWHAGEMGFFPAMSASAVDFCMQGASMQYVAIPNGLLAQAMPISEYRGIFHQNDYVCTHLIKSAVMLNSKDDPLLIESMMIAIVYRIAQWHRGTDEIPESKNENQISRAVEYLNDNIIEQVTLQDLASVACMSQFHFARQFHRVTGRSPHAYLVHKRIEKAKSMLVSGALSVATISYACGFGSQAHFAKQFRAQQGVSPTAFRQEFRPYSARGSE